MLTTMSLFGNFEVRVPAADILTRFVEYAVLLLKSHWSLESEWCTCAKKKWRSTWCASCCATELHILSHKKRCVMSSVRESLMSKLKMRMKQYTMWRDWTGIVLRRWGRSVCQCTTLKSAKKICVRYEVYWLSRSDSEVLVQCHTFNVPKSHDAPGKWKWVYGPFLLRIEKNFFLIMFMKSLNYRHLVIALILSKLFVTLWLCGNITPLLTIMFSIPFNCFSEDHNVCSIVNCWK